MCIIIWIFLSGYPTSGPEANPREFDMPDPIMFDYDPMVVERRGPWRYPFHPPYPLIVKSPGTQQCRASVKEETVEDVGSVVPG